MKRSLMMMGLAAAVLLLHGCPPPNAIHSLTLMATPAQGGAITADPATGSYVAGTEVTLTATPNPGWRFQSWQGVGINNTQSTVVIRVYSDQTLVALFVPLAGEGEGEGEGEPGAIVKDGSFEMGPASADWAALSLNYDYLTCSASRCGTLDGLGPRTGIHWAWFGTAIDGVAEAASLSQDVIMPRTGMATLRFWLDIPRAEAAFTFRVFLGRALVFELTDAGAGDYPGFGEVSIDVSSMADGATVPLLFTYSNPESLNEISAVFVDDVEIINEGLAGEGEGEGEGEPNNGGGKS